MRIFDFFGVCIFPILPHIQLLLRSSIICYRIIDVTRGHGAESRCQQESYA